MNRFFLNIMMLASALGAVSCSEIEDGVSDIDSWDIPEVYEPQTYKFTHPCLLHSSADINYVKSHLTASPWSDGYQKLLSSGYSNVGYKASPVEYLARLDANNWGKLNDRWQNAGIADKWYEGIHNNYTNFFKDCAAAYQLGLKWQLAGDAAAAQSAIGIINAWATKNKGILTNKNGELIDPNENLIMFQVHQIANAMELVRDYNSWGTSPEFTAAVNWLKTAFYPLCSKFLKEQNGQHYWMNWDMAQMTAILSIGILAEDQNMVNEAILYFKQGAGPGNINGKAIVKVFDDPSGSGEKLAQGNESGRDQGHNTLCAAMLGAFCQTAYNIGEDLFSFKDGRAIAFAQYVAKYNLVKKEAGDNYNTANLAADMFVYPESSLPFAEYTYGDKGTMKKISSEQRGNVRPGWDIWAGYCKAHGIKGKYVTEMAERWTPDGGGGHYGPNSGGFDQLGFSTLMHHRE